MSIAGPSRRSFLAGTLLAAGAATLPRTVFGKAEKPRIRMGQIGTAHAHASKLDVYRRNIDFDVVGIVEPDDKRWDAAKDNKAYAGLPRLTEEQLLNTPSLQLVGVETRVQDLVSTGQRCVSAGVHIHLDKPAGANITDFQKLLETATAKQRIVQMGYMLRHSPATLLLKQLMKDGVLGDLFEVHGVMSKVVSPAERKQLAAFPGGMLFELGCHLIDVVIGLLGEPVRTIPLSTRSKSGEVDGLLDNGLVAFMYPHASATVRSTAMEVDGGPRRHLVVCGTKGTFRCEPLESPQVKLSLAADAAGFKKGSQVVPMPKYERYVGDAVDLAATIRGEKPNDYPPAHDLFVHKCVLAASGM